jgi:anti-sigma B factor antagonist
MSTLSGRVPVGDRWRYYAPVLEINAIRHDDDTRVDLCPDGELDAYSVAQFREAFSALADEPRVIVNLSGVQFMDSAGLGALIGGIRRIRESEGRVTIFSDREAITKLLHTTGFDRIVPVKDVLAEAVAALDEDPDA